MKIYYIIIRWYISDTSLSQFEDLLYISDTSLNQFEDLMYISDTSLSQFEDFTYFDDDDLVVIERKQTDQEILSTASQLDSEESFNEEDICDEEKYKDNIPLFVFFTCTVRNRLDYEHVSVQGLIPCLGEGCKNKKNSLGLQFTIPYMLNFHTISHIYLYHFSVL